MVLAAHDVVGPSLSDYEAWRDLLRSRSGRYYSKGVKPHNFTGWVRPISGRGLSVMDIGCNAPRVERTCRDVRLDGADNYVVVFLVDGRLGMIHRDQTVLLAAGDITFVDRARPLTYFCDRAETPWNTICLNLPRQSLVSYIGFEPEGGLCRRGGTPAGRLLFNLIREIGNEEGSTSCPADSYMHLAVYDLVGALFVPPERRMVTNHADKLFARIREVIKDGFSDPAFGPAEVAAKAGISLRYLQKLFTKRGSTCSEHIYSFRLQHADHLLNRRAMLATGQSLREVAYACGFSDYTHFARKFRHRFGDTPGDHAVGQGGAPGTGPTARRTDDAVPRRRLARAGRRDSARVLGKRAP
jgi:AraC-like DNA-binding protein